MFKKTCFLIHRESIWRKDDISSKRGVTVRMNSAAFENAQISREHKNRDGSLKSKLELYENTLEALASNGPMKLELIMNNCCFSRELTLENLSFLIKNNLVEKRTDNFELIYSITKAGERVVSFFKKPSIHSFTFTDHSVM